MENELSNHLTHELFVQIWSRNLSVIFYLRHGELFRWILRIIKVDMYVFVGVEMGLLSAPCHPCIPTPCLMRPCSMQRTYSVVFCNSNISTDTKQRYMYWYSVYP